MVRPSSRPIERTVRARSEHCVPSGIPRQYRRSMGYSSYPPNGRGEWRRHPRRGDGTPCDGRRIRVRGRPRGAEGIPPGKLGAKADQRRRPRRRADLGSNPQRGLVEAEHKVAASERAAQKGMRKRWDTEHAGVVVGPARAHPVEFSPGVDRMGRNPGTKDETRARESQAALRAFLEVAETEPELETPLVEDDQDRPE